jgi:hypothetical protein
MTISDFKRKISQKYETTLDNIIVSHGDKTFDGSLSKNIKLNENSILLKTGLDLDDRSIVKITFKTLPQGL